MTTPRPEDVLRALKQAGTRMRAAGEKHRLRSAAPFYGVPLPRVRALVRPLAADLADRGDLGGVLRFGTCLWAAGAHESRVAAILILATCDRLFDDRVWTLGETWLRDVDNRVLCDGICPVLLAPFLQRARPRHRSRRRRVLAWTRDAGPWVRRGALVANVRSVCLDREWRFLFDVAGRLLADGAPPVQSALGWMLRECASHNPREVITFIQRHRQAMRRSTITRAVSRLPKTLQRAAREG